MSQESTGKASSTPPFLEYAFRPFFFAAALWAVASVALWVGSVIGWPTLPDGTDGFEWHRHEVIYGFLGAAIGGFILTAVPNWTSRPAVSGWVLAVLVLLWAAGRAANLLTSIIPLTATMLLDLAFPAALVIIVAREVVASENWRNLVPVVLIALFMSGSLFDYLAALGHLELGIPGNRLSLLSLTILLALIAGRIVPSFTRNWLTARNVETLPAEFGAVDRVSLILLVLFALSYLFVGDGYATAGLAAFAAISHAIRLIRWRGWLSRSEPLVWILHVAYLWLIVALGLFAGSALVLIPETAALHALGSGLFGTMILAVATRASLGHSGHALKAGPGTLVIYLLIIVAAVIRVASPLVGGDAEEPVRDLSAAAWIAAFGLFAVLYFPVWITKRQDA